jgi:hypothetical protein
LGGVLKGTYKAGSKRWMKRRRIKAPYVAGEEFNYLWDEDEVKAFIKLYIELREAGNNTPDTIWYLAKQFKRKEPDVAILIMDLGERYFISGEGKGRFEHFRMERELDEGN